MELIKVPSCDEHNSKKSQCDEYLKFVLTAVGGMNELANSVFAESVMRSFDYRPQLIDKFMPELQVIRVGAHETAGFKLDWHRFQHSIASIVCGLHFHETGRKLVGAISGAAWAKLLTGNYTKAPFLESIRRTECEFPAAYVGANPRVFQYAFGISKSGNTFFCRLRFYEGHPIYSTWKKDC